MLWQKGSDEIDKIIYYFIFFELDCKICLFSLSILAKTMLSPHDSLTLVESICEQLTLTSSIYTTYKAFNTLSLFYFFKTSILSKYNYLSYMYN